VHREWLNFDLRRAFREACTQDVRVVNDATLAALGYCEGRGKELVFTLGTGFGIALVVNGSPKRIRDVGAEEFVDGRTYDELLGEPSRANDEDRWYQLLHSAVSSFADEFGADIVHFGGGNARLLDVGRFADLKCRIVINGYEDTLRGAARLFDR
jgi:polyphosphate glucokinase